MTRVIRADQRGPARRPSVVLTAEERAAEIVAEARAEAAALRADALQEGRAEGRAEYAAQLLALAAERERVLATLEPQALEVALLAAKRVIGDELAADAERFAKLVCELLARVRRAQEIRVHVHPDDAAALAPLRAALRERTGLAYEPTIEPSPELARGDCIVVTELGTLDARIDTQLAALARALKTG